MRDGGERDKRPTARRRDNDRSWSVASSRCRSCRVLIASIFALASATLAAPGCALGPDGPPIAESPAKTWAEVSTATPTAGILAAPPTPDFAFWRELKDPLVVELVEAALRESPDIARATARIRESRDLAGVATAALFPEVDGNASYSKQRFSTVSPTFSKIDVSSIPGFDPNSDDWKASMTMSYELDIWGKNRRARQAALLDLLGDVERRRSVALTLAGDVTTGYVDYRTLERRRDVAVRTLGSRRTALELVRDRERAGLGTDLDVARAEADLATVAATIPDLEKQIAIAEHRLAILTGAAPGTLRQRLAAAGAGRLAPFAVPVGLPAELLLRRPDIRELAARLAATTARIGQSKADLFPTVTLTGELGVEAYDVGVIAERAAGYWLAGPQLRVPLFDAMRRVNAWHAAEEREGEAFADLAKEVLQALGEAEDALASVREDARRRDTLAEAAAASRRATDIATLKFQNGLVAYLDVVDAERQQFQAEDALAAVDGLVARDAVVLAKAVGGGTQATERLLPQVEPPEGAPEKPRRESD